RSAPPDQVLRYDTKLWMRDLMEARRTFPSDQRRKPAGERRREGTPKLKGVAGEGRARGPGPGPGWARAGGGAADACRRRGGGGAGPPRQRGAGGGGGGAGPRAGGASGPARPGRASRPAGAVGVRTPRVDDRRADPVTGERARFRSSILPPWCCKSRKVTE